jgi:zinc transport system ATP-binding protein
LKKNALEFKDVTFSYSKEPALENVSFSIKAGEFIGVIGPNGSGKSTLLKVAMGLEKPQNGEVLLFGEKGFNDWHRVGYVQQKPSFGPDFPATVFEVASMGLFYKLGVRPLSKEDKKAVHLALHEVGLEEQYSKRIGELSGGQIQRALLARALVGQPEMLLLDEPTTGIDAVQQEKFCCLLDRLHQKGITIVMVSHDLTFISQLVDNVLCINKQLHYCGHPNKLSSSKVLPKVYGHDVQVVRHVHPVC